MGKLHGIALGVCSCLAGTSGSWTASAAAGDTSATGDTDTLQEIVVTAERREENIQKTPMNVTVITGDVIQKQGLTDIQEILQAVPGVNVQGQVRGFTVTVRGLGTDLPPGSAQGAVAVVQDNVYDIRAESGTLGFYDLARTEVLAGPQGTLYGVNSDGGVVNIISNNPTVGKFDSSGSVSFGSYNLVQGQAMINLPVSDTSALRIAATAVNRDGFLDTGASDSNGQGARAKYLWKPSDSFSLLLGFEAAKLGGKGSGSILAYQNGDCHTVYNVYTASFSHIANCWTDQTSPIYGITLGGTNTAGTVQSDADQWQNYHSDKYWAEVKWDTNIGTVSFTPSYKSDYATDFACGMGLCSLGGDPGKLQQNSAELKLSQPAGSKLQWTVGLYHWGYLQYTYGAGPAGSVYQTSNAAFGEITYPASDAFRLKAGVRESQDWKNETGAPTPITFHHFDYRVGFEYDVAPQSMLYGIVATGYRPGGYETTAPAVTTYKTEQVTDYEVGIKNRFFGDRLQINADAFYYNYQNYQLLDFYALGSLYCNNALNPPGPPVFDYLNLAARNVGVDLSSSWLASSHDTVNASITYLNNKFTTPATVKYNPVNNCQAYDQGSDPTETNTVVTQSVSAQVQPHSPSVSGSVNWEHRFTLADGASLAMRPVVRFTSGYYVNPIEFAYSYQPTFTEYDLSGSYSSADDKWTLSVWGRNLGNYAEKTNFVAGTGGIGEPRTYGVTVSAHL